MNLVRRTMLETEHYISAESTPSGIYDEKNNCLLDFTELYNCLLVKRRNIGDVVTLRITGEEDATVYNIVDDEYIVHRGGPTVKVQIFELLSKPKVSDFKAILMNEVPFCVAVDDENQPVSYKDHKIIFIQS